MPIDGIFLHAIKHELSLLIGARVEKITQPEKDEIIIYMHSSSNVRLLLSANPSNPRIHLIKEQKENPIVPPNFCMLLRKHLLSSRLINIEQPGYERVLVLTFEGRTELYEKTEKKLIIEIMGRHSNIIITNSDNSILDAIKQVDFSKSSKRQILQGLKYEFPPTQNKLIINNNNCYIDFSNYGESKVEKVLMDTFQGFSSLLTREIVYIATGLIDIKSSELNNNQKDKIYFQLKKLISLIENNEYIPQIININEKLTDYHCFNINQYGINSKNIIYNNFGELLDNFYAEKDLIEHIKRNSTDILRVITNNIEKTSRKIELQKGEIADCEKADEFKLFADMITSNLFRLTKLKGGETSVLLIDYTSEDLKEREISLNSKYSPALNAQQYYKLYKKAQTAKIYLQKLIDEAATELIYLDSIFEALVRAKKINDLQEIRKELINGGYIKLKGKPVGNKKDTPVKFLEYISDDGFIIYAGKNNLQNDYLTTKIADKHDIWFHIKGFPGSHVVIIRKGKDLSSETLTLAAAIAAQNSKASGSVNVAVDYTEVKNVKKPNGSKPGMVIYVNYKTAYVTPSEMNLEKYIKQL